MSNGVVQSIIANGARRTYKSTSETMASDHNGPGETYVVVEAVALESSSPGFKFWHLTH